MTVTEKLIEKYKNKLDALKVQKSVLEKEILWVEEFIENVKKEDESFTFMEDGDVNV